MSVLIKAEGAAPPGVQHEPIDEHTQSPDGAQTHLSMEDDDALVQAAIGDRLQFGELYHRYVGRVYKYIFARVGDTHDAQDLTSQTFLAALQDIDRYRGCGQFAAWLFTIALCRI